MIRPAILCLCLASPLLAQDEGKKVALLVGVKTYGGDTKLRNLDYTENDVDDLKKVLEKLGYDVTLLTRTEAKKLDRDELRPTGKNIRKQLDLIVLNRKPADTLLVAFSGHGAHLKSTDKLYFCPADTDLADVKSLVAVDDVMATLKSCKAGGKALLMDACRNDPADGRTGATPDELKSNSRPLIPDLPGGTVAMFSCSKAQISHESDVNKRGFLFHCVIEGLSGKAASKKTGLVTWSGLANYVEEELPDAVRKEKGSKQIPDILGESRGLVLGRIASEPDPLSSPFSKDDIDRSRKAWADHLKTNGTLITDTGLKLALIPPGSFEMGADEEADSVVKEFPVEEAKTFANEHPSKRHTIKSAIYFSTREVTVGQFRQFVKERRYLTEHEKGITEKNPTGAKFEPGDKGWAAPGFKDWSEEHPVTHVSHTDAKAFCEWLSKKEGMTFRLPTQAEWEYVCRAGTRTRYWTGNDPESLLGSANVPDKSCKATDTSLSHTGFLWYADRDKDGKVTKWNAFTFRGGQAVTFETDGDDFKIRAQDDGGVRKDRIVLRNKVPGASFMLANLTAQWEMVSGEEKGFMDLRKSYAIDGDDGYPEAAPVGKFTANPFGIFDMHGNVWEWCEDPMLVDGKERYVLRGGCFL